MKSLSVVLGQEIERFNNLTTIVIASLAELQKAIKGVVVMSGELEQMYTNFLNNQVPGRLGARRVPVAQAPRRLDRGLPPQDRVRAHVAAATATRRRTGSPGSSSRRGS